MSGVVRAALRLLDDAIALARDLELDGLATLLEGERDRLERPELRVTLVGPATSGKTSTLLALLGAAGVAEDGEPLLPVGVRPTTAHLVEVRAEGEVFSAAVVRRDGTEAAVVTPAALRAELTRPDARVLRALVCVPGAVSVGPDLVLLDTPGVAAADQAWADDLVEEALALADVVLLHVRVPRGVGPVRTLLARLGTLHPDLVDLRSRLVPVLTDVRLPGRIPEILDGVAGALVGPPLPHVEVPRRGQVEALRSRLAELATDPRLRPRPAVRALAVLRDVALPLFEAFLVLAEERGEWSVQTREYLDGQIREANDAASFLRRTVQEGRERATSELGAAVARARSEAEAELLAVIEDAERLAWREHLEDCTRSLDDRLLERFPDEAERLLDSVMGDVVARCNERLAAFQQELERHALHGEPPGLDEFERTAAGLGTGWAGRRFFAYANRLGGFAGVKMGVINLARKGMARAYHLLGRKAPAEMIRRTIPRVVGPLGGAVKFLARRAWVLDVAVELLSEVWGLLRAKPRLRAHVRTLLDSWEDGPKPSLLARLRGQATRSGVRDGVRQMVTLAWDGGEIPAEAGGEAVEVEGLAGQVQAAIEEIEKLIADWRREADEEEARARSLSGRRERVAELAARVAAAREETE